MMLGTPTARSVFASTEMGFRPGTSSYGMDPNGMALPLSAQCREPGATLAGRGTPAPVGFVPVGRFDNLSTVPTLLSVAIP